MNDKKTKVFLVIKKVFSVFTGLVTLFASIATCITVWEMRDERNQSYKPYFIIESASINEELKGSTFDVHDTLNLVESLSVSEKELVPIDIVFDNIGSGTATDICVSFSPKMYKAYWKTICQYYDNNDIDVSDNDLKVNYFLSSYNKSFTHEHTMVLSDLKTKKPYVFTKKSISIPLPEEYRRIIHSIAYCTNGDYGNIPPIELEICYNDLQGINYSKKLKLGVKVYIKTKTSSEAEIKRTAKYVIEQIK